MMMQCWIFDSNDRSLKVQDILQRVNELIHMYRLSYTKQGKTMKANNRKLFEAIKIY